MTLQKITTALFSLVVFQGFAQDTATSALSQPEQKISYLDSIKSTFVKDRMAACVDSLWLKELTSLDLYNNISEDIKTLNLDEKVDYELPTALFKERLKKLDEKSPFHIEYNPGLENIVKSWLKNRKQAFERLMAVSEYYFPMFEESLARQNVPLEIKYLAVVESALNPKAVSRVGATGLWQFMYQTGKQYDLTIDSYVDERNDPLKASDAAAQYMANMYKIFGDWDLVLASYNSGPGNVAKAIRRSGGRQNYWNIRKYLPNETAGYVPAFLATMYIWEYHKEHGIIPERALVKHFQTDTVAVRHQLTFRQISDLLDIPVAQLQMLNPSYKINTVPNYFDKLHYLRLPSDKIALFTSNEDKIYAYAAHEENLREKPYSQIAARLRDTTNFAWGERTVTRTKFHKVRKGDNLSQIAARYDVSVAEIKKWNHLKSNTAPKGKSLKIITTDRIAYKMKKDKAAVKPEFAVTPEKAVAEKDVKKETSSEIASTDTQYYTVEPGDNLSAVARKYGVSVRDIKQWNNFDDDDLLAGTKIIVSKAGETVAEVEKPELKNIEYTVKKGDFLSIIAKKNDVTSDQIKEWNNMDNNIIHVGQKLIVGKVDTSVAAIEKTKSDKVAAKVRLQEEHYLVQKGDSLFSIAKKYPGITVSDIKKWNGIKGESIQPGMKLKING